MTKYTRLTISGAIGAVIGGLMSYWLFFPYAIFAADVDGFFMRAIALIITVGLGLIGGAIGDSLHD